MRSFVSRSFLACFMALVEGLIHFSCVEAHALLAEEISW